MDELPDNLLLVRDQYVDAERIATDIYDAKWFIKALKDRDARLSLIFVKAGARGFEHTERFYITRVSEDMEPQFWVIQDEHGMYCEPQQRHLDRFFSGDAAFNPRVKEEMDRNRDERHVRAARAKQELLDETADKLQTRMKMIFDGKGILVPRDLDDA